MQTFRPQARPLQHAEPMLLVDDHESELFEPDVPFDERVRADDEMNRPGLDLRELLPAK